MKKRSREEEARLLLAKRRRALTPLLPLFDDYWARAELLKAKGWSSFEPYWQFRRSLCTADDWHFYERYVIEDTKEALGDYHSRLMDELRAQVGSEEAYRAVGCARAYEGLRRTPNYRVAWEPYRQEQMRRRRLEVELRGTSISRTRVTDDEQIERIRIWKDVVNEMGKDLGFEPASRSSGRYAPIFTRALTADWELVLGVSSKSLGFESNEWSDLRTMRRSSGCLRLTSNPEEGR